jgi:hypothetical protein
MPAHGRRYSWAWPGASGTPGAQRGGPPPGHDGRRGRGSMPKPASGSICPLQPASVSPQARHAVLPPRGRSPARGWRLGEEGVPYATSRVGRPAHRRGGRRQSPPGDWHVYGCDTERCPWCGGRLMACGGLLDRVAIPTALRCGGEACVLPQAMWGSLLAFRCRPSVPHGGALCYWPVWPSSHCWRVSTIATCGGWRQHGNAWSGDPAPPTLGVPNEATVDCRMDELAALWPVDGRSASARAGGRGTGSAVAWCVSTDQAPSVLGGLWRLWDGTHPPRRARPARRNR